MEEQNKKLTYALIALAGILVIAGIVYFGARPEEERVVPSQTQSHKYPVLL